MFSFIFLQLLPIYILIFLGFLAGKLWDIDKKGIANLLIYFFVPIVVFNGVVNLKFQINYLILPIFIFILCCLISIICYFLASFIWKDSRKNVIAFACGYGNFGFFALPVGIALFGKNYEALIVLTGFGMQLFQDSLGYFLVAKSNFSTKDSLLKTLKLPTFYAFLFGILINFLDWKVFIDWTVYLSFINYIRGAFVVLGMVIIGLNLADVNFVKIDWKFLFGIFFGKFVLWPITIFSLILLDKSILQLFSSDIYQILVLFSALPLASMVSIYASQLKTEPEKVSLATAMSTIFAMFFIPFIIMIGVNL
jgi:predicted permease